MSEEKPVEKQSNKRIMNWKEIEDFRKQWGVMIRSKKEAKKNSVVGEINIKWKISELKQLTDDDLCDALSDGEYIFHGCAKDHREAYAIIRKIQNERVASKVML